MPTLPGQAPGPTRMAAQPREKKRLGRQGGPKHNNARTGTTAQGSTAQGRANHPKPPHPCRSQGGPPSPKPGGGRAEDKRQGLPRGTCFGPITTTVPRRALQGSARGPLGPASGGPRPLRPLLKFEGAASQRPPAHRRERGPGGQATRPIYWADCRWGARIPQPLCARRLPGTKKPRDKWGSSGWGGGACAAPTAGAPAKCGTTSRQTHCLSGRAAPYQGSSHIR